MSNIFKTIWEACKKHSPELLTGFGIAGMLTTTVIAVRATPKAMKKIEEKKEELGKEKLSVKETVVATWKCYIPAVVTAAASTAALVGSTTISLNRNTVLATGLAISEAARKEFEEKTKEVIGEKKVDQIKEEVAKDKVKYADCPDTKSLSTVGFASSYLCKDNVTNQFFMSDHETVRKIFNDLNSRLMREMYLTVNEYTDAFNIDHVPWGNDMQWDVNKRPFDPIITYGSTKDGVPCMIIDFDKDDYLNLR